MTGKTSKAVFLKAYPAGMPEPAGFETREIDVPAPGDGEMLCRTVWMSVDPYMRGRMRPDIKSYIPPFSLDAPLEGGPSPKSLNRTTQPFRRAIMWSISWVAGRNIISRKASERRKSIRNWRRCRPISACWACRA